MNPQSRPDFMGADHGISLFTVDPIEFLILLPLPYSILIEGVLIWTSYSIDAFQWVSVTLLVALLVHLLLYFIKKVRFCNPIADARILVLFEEVKQDMKMGHGIELWLRRVDRQILASTVNPRFKAILLSESTIADLLEKALEGKVLLAKEVLEMERKKPLIRLVLGMVGFTLLAALVRTGLSDVGILLLLSAGPAGIALVILAALGAIAVVFVIESRFNADVNEIIEGIYGIPPDAAAVEVLFGVDIPSEMLGEMKRDESEDISHRGKALRNGAIAAIIITPVVFVTMLSILGMSLPFSLSTTIIVTAICGVMVFITVFFLSVSWLSMQPKREPRSTEFQFHDSFTAAIQKFLNAHPDYERVVVNGVKSPFIDRAGLMVIRIDENSEEKTLYGLIPNMLKDIDEPGLAGPFILSELKRGTIEERTNRISYLSLSLAFTFLILNLLVALITLSIHGFFMAIFQILVVYILIGVMPPIVVLLWKRRLEVQSDTEIALRHPRFIEALQILISMHHTLPYGQASYRTRLERINKQLGTESRQVKEDSKLGLE